MGHLKCEGITFTLGYRVEDLNNLPRPCVGLLVCGVFEWM